VVEALEVTNEPRRNPFDHTDRAEDHVAGDRKNTVHQTLAPLISTWATRYRDARLAATDN
jgi:hypothetical protein